MWSFVHIKLVRLKYFYRMFDIIICLIVQTFALKRKLKCEEKPQTLAFLLKYWERANILIIRIENQSFKVKLNAFHIALVHSCDIWNLAIRIYMIFIKFLLKTLLFQSQEVSETLLYWAFIFLKTFIVFSYSYRFLYTQRFIQFSEKSFKFPISLIYTLYVSNTQKLSWMH